MRKSRRRTEEVPNHDRWLISYADLVTTLFAFFVVLFASSYRDNRSIRGVSQAIQIGFQQMGAFSGAQATAGTANPSLTRGTLSQDPLAPKPDSAAAAIDIDALRKQLEAAIGKELKNHEVDTRVTPEGFVISLKELGFFNSGQATLMPGAAEKITRISKVLAEHGLDLRVEGHSDNQPIHTSQFHSNWELSTARAMAVMSLIVNDSGFDPTKISVAGYGQYRPLADNATPEGRRMNRRIDLVVVGAAPGKTPGL